MSNPFNCPDRVYDAMREAGPVGMSILYLVRKLGPERVQWAGTPPVDTLHGIKAAPTTWALDGVRASWEDLRRALTEKEERKSA